MVPVHAVLPAVLAEILRKAPLSPEKVSFAWRQAAGDALDRATRAELHDQALVVYVRDRTWKREIERAIPTLRPRLESVLGRGAFSRIEVTIASS